MDFAQHGRSWARSNGAAVQRAASAPRDGIKKGTISRAKRSGGMRVFGSWGRPFACYQHADITPAPNHLAWRAFGGTTPHIGSPHKKWLFRRVVKIRIQPRCKARFWCASGCPGCLITVDQSFKVARNPCELFRIVLHLFEHLGDSAKPTIR